MKKTKEETPDFDSLLKSMNTGVNKLILINKNLGDVKLGVKNANAKIVNSNLGIKSLNTKLVSIDKNIARLLTSLTNVPTKKEENYLSEQYQNESIRETKLTNDLLLDIKNSLKNGPKINVGKDGGGLGGILGLMGLAGGMKMMGSKGFKLAMKTTKFAGKRVLTPLFLLLAASQGYSTIEGDETDKLKGAAKGALDEFMSMFSDIGDLAKDFFNLDVLSKKGEETTSELSEVLDFVGKDFKNVFGEFGELINLFTVPEWLNPKTWESLYVNPDDFMEKIQGGVNPLGMVKSGIGTVGTGSKMVAGVKKAASDTDKRAYMSYAEEVAKKEGIDPNIMKGLIQQESNWNPNAVSSAGAIGLTQMLPTTVGDVGGHPEDLFDPYKNIQYGARYLKTLLNRYNGDYNKALTAYHSGMGNVVKGNIGPIGQVYASQVQEKAGAFRELGPVGTGEPYKFAPDVPLGQAMGDAAKVVIKVGGEGIGNMINPEAVKNASQIPIDTRLDVLRQSLYDMRNKQDGFDPNNPKTWGLDAIKEQSRTRNMQNKAIEATTKDKTTAVTPVVNNNNIMANNATQNQNQNINSDSIFDWQYAKMFLNPNYNKV